MIVHLLGYRAVLGTGEPTEDKTDIVLILMGRLESKIKQN